MSGPNRPTIELADWDGVLYAARVIDDVVWDLSAQRAADRLTEGTVLAGRIAKVLPKGRGALVDIGLSGASPLRSTKGLSEGALLPVQLLASKRAMRDCKLPPVTSDIVLPGRFLLHRPFSDGIGFSRRLSKQRRQDFNHLGDDFGAGGWLVRAAAAGQSTETLLAEAQHHERSAQPISKSLASVQPGTVLHPGPTVWQRAILDEPDIQSVRATPGRFGHDLAGWLKTACPSAEPLVEDHVPRSLEMLADNIDTLMTPEVALPGGATLWIERTRAMTAIDVDAPLGTGPGEINRQAAEAIARHVRLRNVGGMIAIDFLRMAGADDRKRVLRHLHEKLRQNESGSAAQLDLAPGFSPVGPYLFSRQRRGCPLSSVIDGMDE